MVAELVVPRKFGSRLGEFVGGSFGVRWASVWMKELLVAWQSWLKRLLAVFGDYRALVIVGG